MLGDIGCELVVRRRIGTMVRTHKIYRRKMADRTYERDVAHELSHAFGSSNLVRSY